MNTRVGRCLAAHRRDGRFDDSCLACKHGLPGSAFSFRRAAALLALLVFAAGLSGCDKLKARDLLNKGVSAFKNGQYDAAVEDFKQAKDLDPSLLNARLYLATAYASQYIPGAPSEQNKNIGRQAIGNSRTSSAAIPTTSVPSTASVPSCSRWPARLTIQSSSKNPKPITRNIFS